MYLVAKACSNVKIASHHKIRKRRAKTTLLVFDLTVLVAFEQYIRWLLAHTHTHNACGQHTATNSKIEWPCQRKSYGKRTQLSLYRIYAMCRDVNRLFAFSLRLFFIRISHSMHSSQFYIYWPHHWFTYQSFSFGDLFVQLWLLHWWVCCCTRMTLFSSSFLWPPNFTLPIENAVKGICFQFNASFINLVFLSFRWCMCVWLLHRTQPI